MHFVSEFLIKFCFSVALDVDSILKEKGELVNTQTPVAIIGDAEVFELELQVDEYDVTRIKAGQKILLSLDSYKGKIFEAVVRRIDPIMNDRTRSFKVEAVFNLDHQIVRLFRP